jgi:adhesin/invasin
MNVTSAEPSITVTPGPVSLAQSSVTVSPSSIQAGSPTTVTLTLRDSSGNQEVGGGATVSFNLGAGTASGSFSAVSDNRNGTYTATLTGATAGTNTIGATVNGQAVTATPPTVTVTPGPYSLSQSYVAVSTPTVPSGTTAIVTLQARDADGNNETGASLNVAFFLGSGANNGVLSGVTAHANGTYASSTFAVLQPYRTVHAAGRILPIAWAAVTVWREGLVRLNAAGTGWLKPLTVTASNPLSFSIFVTPCN